MSSLFCLDYYNFGGLEVMYYDYIACFLCFSPKTTLDSLILFHYHVQIFFSGDFKAIFFIPI